MKLLVLVNEELSSAPITLLSNIPSVHVTVFDYDLSRTQSYTNLVYVFCCREVPYVRTMHI